ncbi:MAG: hypothetical protein KDA41_09755, partial [Planctomycetales bacterium]|nr:hypothetical protein [Planctomycetales bacterium]
MNTESASPEIDAARLAALRLSLTSGVGPLTMRALVDHFGSPLDVLAATGAQLRETPGVGPKIAAAILAAD